MTREIYKRRAGERVVDRRYPYRHGVVVEDLPEYAAPGDVPVRWDGEASPVREVPHFLASEQS